MQENEKMMKRVQVTVSAGKSEDEWNFTPEPLKFEFIYGVGSGGLSQFEVALTELQFGDELELYCKQDQVEGYFAHLFPAIQQELGLWVLPHELFFRIMYNGATEPSPAEIVKAMAKSSGSCGCGGGCGCG